MNRQPVVCSFFVYIDDDDCRNCVDASAPPGIAVRAYSTIIKNVPTHKNRMNETPINKYFTVLSPVIVTPAMIPIVRFTVQDHSATLQIVPLSLPGAWRPMTESALNLRLVTG
ncbi:hypothetical protein [Musicola paradisiaca]|uniref:hypothetical protein n=1 Tax=Musicola paradisiaca TaxID=69223 RepID=UPI0021F6916F|nr:hypothetical protein [Musicola paradisiaca]